DGQIFTLYAIDGPAHQTVELANAVVHVDHIVPWLEVCVGRFGCFSYSTAAQPGLWPPPAEDFAVGEQMQVRPIHGREAPSFSQAAFNKHRLDVAIGLLQGLILPELGQARGLA